jgi:hypothetical protein
MPTTELFVVDSAGVAKKVSKLSARFYRYKKQIAAGGKMDPSRVSVNSSHPAVTAARQRGKASMARETPPTRTSPRQLAKKAASTTATTARSTGLARSGASSLARTALARSNRSVGSPESATLGILNIPTTAAELPASEEDEDEDEDDDDDSAINTGNLFPPNEEEGGGDDDDSDFPDNLDFPNDDDADSVPDAEINKYSFLERLRHYMDGNKISDANRKCVEWAILFEVGTLVRNMDTMRTADMEASIFGKYVNIVHDIEDEHFECDSVRAKMLHMYKSGKKDLPGRSLLRKWKSETADFRSFWYKFPGVRRMSDLPSGSNQIKHMKKPYIASLWAKDNPVRYSVVRSAGICRISHKLLPVFIRTKWESTTMISTLSLLESQRIGGLLRSHASICLRVLCTRVTPT